MIQLLGASNTQSEEIKGRTVRRLAVSVRFGLPTGAAVTGIDLSAITIKAILRRENQDHVIFHDKLQPLAMESMYHAGLQYASTAALAHAVGVSGANTQYLLPLMIDLLTGVNIQGNDSLYFEASCSAGWLPSNAITSLCSISLYWRDDIDIERYIPMILCQAVQPNASSFDWAPGDNVTQVSLINTEYFPVNPTDANTAFTLMSILSDRYDVNDDLDRAIGRRVAQFESYGEAAQRGRNFQVVFNGEADKVRISLTLVPANITTGKHFVIVRKHKIDGYTLERAERIEQKHANYDASKVLNAIKA